MDSIVNDRRVFYISDVSRVIEQDAVHASGGGATYDRVITRGYRLQDRLSAEWRSHRVSLGALCLVTPDPPVFQRTRCASRIVDALFIMHNHDMVSRKKSTALCFVCVSLRINVVKSSG